MKSPRSVAIDAFRALIMLLMIFVNDLWTLHNIPGWLEHVPANVDGMGLADIVFPSFLFIVGLSIPFAVESRRRRNDTVPVIFIHVLSRTVALLVMGIFMVNAEMYGKAAMLPRNIWMILLILAFFLVWTAYKNPGATSVKIKKTCGLLLLVVLAFLYGNENASGFSAMRIYWWGILGLIGWGYFIATSVYLFSGGKFLVQIIAFLFFLVFSAASSLGWLGFLEPVRPYLWISGDGAMPALCMAGVITAVIYKKYGAGQSMFWIWLAVFALVLFAIGWATRPAWGISKNRATPSWVCICSGLSLICFMLITWMTDLRKQTKWYNLIRPGGTSTLTCYLIPYIHYALISMTALQLPSLLRDGALGILKSLLYALAIIVFTGLLEKKNIRLKI
ncbi:DUF5009 domain-containing protein [Arcticibacter sp.]|uniref:DUF5009 domain-containing protein n=1 Tax=Arcticibacter sp. TaxID=1872630 RepID=UPI00389088EF